MPTKLTTEDFIAKARKIHGDRYDYSLVNYVSAKSNVDIICKAHGVFAQFPNNHLGGKGCPECAKTARWDGRRQTTEGFIALAKSVHGDRYDYSKTVFTSKDDKVIIGCQTHGDFLQTPGDHTQGYGCMSCGYEASNRAKIKWTQDEFIAAARVTHGDKYNYDKTVYTYLFKPVIITCPLHGDFEQIPNNHVQGRGCHICGGSKKLTVDEFILRARAIHGDKYDYSLVKYINYGIGVDIICREHGVFNQIPSNHILGKGCSACGNYGPSTPEQELSEFIATLVETVTSDRTVISPQEIDCLIPSKKLGVEFCGIYWHSEKYKSDHYHLNKLKAANTAGLDLIQVFGDEWGNNPHIVKSIIKTRLGLAANVIHARKTQIRAVTTPDIRDFLDANHLQGYAAAEVRLGLYSGEELVMSASFSTNRATVSSLPEGWYELVRLCTKLDTVVVGGFSKLLKHFIKTYSPLGVKSFCDRRYFTGTGYEAVGFIKSHDSKAQYSYVKRDIRYSRFMFQKHKLAAKLEKFDPNLSEKENMLNNGYLRIYDCGHAVYEMALN